MKNLLPLMKYINAVNGRMTMKRVLLCAAIFIIHTSLFTLQAQDVIVSPEISYAGTPRLCEIGGLSVEGIEGYDDYVLTGLSGLSGLTGLSMEPTASVHDVNTLAPQRRMAASIQWIIFFITSTKFCLIKMNCRRRVDAFGGK